MSDMKVTVGCAFEAEASRQFIDACYSGGGIGIAELHPQDTTGFGRRHWLLMLLSVGRLSFRLVPAQGEHCFIPGEEEGIFART